MGSDTVGCDYFRAMVEASPASIVIVAADGAVRFVNAEAERMFGYARQELIGRPIELLVPMRFRRRHAALRRSFFASPSRRFMGAGRELSGRRRDGSEFPVEIGLAPIDAVGGGALVTATVVDVTERREAEQTLAQSVGELEHSNEQLMQFAYVASLDLEAPLLEIAEQSARLDKAIAACDREAMLAASQSMRHSALAARKLVEDLLVYARTIYGDQRLEVLELREELGFALAELAQPIAESGARVRVQAPAATFIADRAQFARLLQNIVANAIKYRKPGCACKVDIVATIEDLSTIRLAIVDNGVGFDADFAQRIFEPFSRPQSDIEYAGTGIELAICKSIADRHGWRLAVQSQPGRGATFSFVIPTLFAIPEPRDA